MQRSNKKNNKISDKDDEKEKQMQKKAKKKGKRGKKKRRRISKVIRGGTDSIIFIMTELKFFNYTHPTYLLCNKICAQLRQNCISVKMTLGLLCS